MTKQTYLQLNNCLRRYIMPAFLKPLEYFSNGTKNNANKIIINNRKKKKKIISHVRQGSKDHRHQN